MVSSKERDADQKIGQVPVIIALDKHIIHFLPVTVIEGDNVEPICSIDITFVNYSRVEDQEKPRVRKSGEEGVADLKMDSANDDIVKHQFIIGVEGQGQLLVTLQTQEEHQEWE